MVGADRVRRAVFWTVDRARGGLIRRHLTDLERLWADPVRLPGHTEARLRELLDHATRTVPVYAPYRGAQRLDALPVIDKAFVRAHYDDFFSTRYRRASLTMVRTSGSYGTPFVFYQSPTKRARKLAEVIFFNRWVGYEVGARHVLVRTKPKPLLSRVLQNEVLIDPTTIDLPWLRRQRRRLQTDRAAIIIGHASALGVLAEYCAAEGDTPARYRITGCLAYAEALPAHVRETIERIFGCLALSRYSTEEFGVLAHECRVHRRYHLNLPSYIVEVLAVDADRPAAPGELGRIVVTDLFADAMPLIRYDTGDFGARGGACGCGLPFPILDRLEGRAVEAVYDPEHRRVSPIAICGALRDTEEVLQFQFIQKDRAAYQLRLRVGPRFREEAAVVGRLRAILGPEADLHVDYVPDIPPLPSGKRPLIVNEYRGARPPADRPGSVVA